MKKYVIDYSFAISILLSLLGFQNHLYANQRNISIYAYAHQKSPEHIQALKDMLNTAKLVPDSIICGIGGFEKSGEYYNWDCDLFFDNYGHIGAIESSQNQLYPKDAVAGIKKLKKSKYYNMVDSFTLDCEPFFQGKINNIAFHIAFIENIKKPTSIYINPKNLVSLKKKSPEQLNDFMKALKKKHSKVLLPAYSYDRDSPRYVDILAVIKICNKYGVSYELILDTKQASRLAPRIDQLKKINGVNLSSFSIFSLEIDNNSLNSAKYDKYFGTRPYGSVEQQYENYRQSIAIINDKLISQ
ncbi:hypothetical protein LA56_966 [Francisella philomiragia]|uniref:hypothetical protein n=1 Tax=Francisella philomiragia TaxID=28110 RepID=UPI0005A57B0B|nr:hypothetical protein [Francisella philomiragia]AJI55015.1 hypothetical protein LA56_966 [Francisella philomiragia]MBK2253695.1 hypothetical protein [Francisella philomiragia]